MTSWQTEDPCCFIETILIVDDRPLFREALGHWLRSMQLTSSVIDAEDHESALRIARMDCPQIVILRITPHRNDGLDLCAELASMDDGPIIVGLLEHPLPTLIRRTLQSGASTVISPFCPSRQLREALEASLEGKNYLPPYLAEVVLSQDHTQSGTLGLTRREQEIFQRLAEGFSAAETAEKLGITRKTVESHRHNLMKKMGLRNTAELVRCAIARDIAPLQPTEFR